MNTLATTTSAEIFEKIRGILIDALSVDEQDVVLAAKLFADLGAESIDFLDIVFRSEKTFGLKIEASDYPPRVLLDMYDGGEEERSKDRAQFVNEVRQQFEQKLPFPFKTPPDAEFAEDLLTVELLCRDIAHRLNVPWSPEGLQ